MFPFFMSDSIQTLALSTTLINKQYLWQRCHIEQAAVSPWTALCIICGSITPSVVTRQHDTGVKINSKTSLNIKITYNRSYRIEIVTIKTIQAKISGCISRLNCTQMPGGNNIYSPHFCSDSFYQHHNAPATCSLHGRSSLLATQWCSIK